MVPAPAANGGDGDKIAFKDLVSSARLQRPGRSLRFPRGYWQTLSRFFCTLLNIIVPVPLP
jgi:hypothetical protein